MKRTMGIVLLVVVGLAILFSLSQSPVSFVDLLIQPLQAIWGSHERLKSGVLEVSESIEPIQAATHQLLKPFGAVQLIRRYPDNNPSAQEPEQKPEDTTPQPQTR